MSDQQEAAAKWGMFEKYKQLKATQAAIRHQLHEWGEPMSSLARSLTETHPGPEPFSILRANAKFLPTKDQLIKAADDLDTLANDIHKLKHELKQAGMDVDNL